MVSLAKIPLCFFSTCILIVAGEAWHLFFLSGFANNVQKYSDCITRTEKNCVRLQLKGCPDWYPLLPPKIQSSINENRIGCHENNSQLLPFIPCAFLYLSISVGMHMRLEKC